MILVIQFEVLRFGVISTCTVFVVAFGAVKHGFGLEIQ
jgi:hypothetical protein